MRIPNTLFALETMAFRALRFLVANSFDIAYNTSYITLLVKLCSQVHLSGAFDVRASDARMKTLVGTWTNPVNISPTIWSSMGHNCGPS